MNKPTLYDKVRYPSRCYEATHPGRLGAIAKMFGMRPREVRHSRVLEIGCGEGGNIIPLALQFPDAEIVGFDLSLDAIQRAQETIATLGLQNIVVHHADILDVDHRWGDFDYIMAHGVYSWVPEPVRHALLDICAERLTAHGIAYVSYNVRPGWHLNGVIRDVMRFHGEQFESEEEQVEQGLAMIRTLAKAHEGTDSAYARSLQRAVEMLGKFSKHYIFHDFMAPINVALLFTEFVAEVDQHGLQYLSEAEFRSMVMSGVDGPVQAMVQSLGRDLIRSQQYLDFAQNTTFRRSLLVRGGTPLTRSLGADSLQGLYITIYGRTESESAELFDGSEIRFETRNGASVGISSAVGKATLLRLTQAYPAALSFDELVAAVQEWVPDASASAVSGVVLQTFGADLLALHPHRMNHVLEVSDFPVACPLVRLRVSEGVSRVPNRRHENASLTRFDMVMIPLLDGEHDHPSIVEHMRAAVAAGDLTVTADGEPTQDPEIIGPAVEAMVARQLRRLCHGGMLIG